MENEEREIVPGKISKVFLFQNGMLAVFNEKGQQMCQHQGYIHEHLGAVLSECSCATEFTCQSRGRLGKGDVERLYSAYLRQAESQKAQHDAMRDKYLAESKD